MSRNWKERFRKDYLNVAPREGRVSRNECQPCGQKCFNMSRPARGVCVEIVKSEEMSIAFRVAPREGRVSRNYVIWAVLMAFVRRAPRGACE